MPVSPIYVVLIWRFLFVFLKASCSRNPLNPCAKFLNEEREPDLQDIYGHNRIVKPPKSDREIIAEINAAKEKPLNDAEVHEILDDIHSGDDPRVIEGEEIIRAYYETTYKSVGELINQNKDFLSQLSEIKEIYALKHSMKKPGAELRGIVSYHRLSCSA